MDYDNINNELERLKIGEFRHNNIRKKLESLRKQVQELETEAIESEATWRKEESDVTKFEKGNLTTAFLSILGKRTERVDKEKQEALTALMKYELAKTELERVKAEISTLSNESLEFQNCGQRYKALYDQKYDKIMSGDSTESLEIIELQSKISRSSANIKEIDEAITAGKRVLQRLNGVISSLDSAKNWGVYDMIGGDLIASAVKHSRIDEAKSGIAGVQSAMNSFKTELADLEISSLMEIEIGGFAKFADFFLDGIFADWFMQDKIIQSKENVEQAHNQTNVVVQKLERMKVIEQGAIETLKGQIESTIAGS